MKDTVYNQTQFSLEEPFLQPVEASSSQKKKKPEQDKKKQQLQKPPLKTFVVIFLSVIVFCIMILLLFVNRESVQPENLLPSASNTPSDDTQRTPLQEQMSDFAELLERSDPAKQALIFPPVDMELRLDDKKR